MGIATILNLHSRFSGTTDQALSLDELAGVLEEEVLELPFIVRSPDGIYIPNGQDAQIAAAEWLREHTAPDDFKIKATLSRLPDAWPREE